MTVRKEGVGVWIRGLFAVGAANRESMFRLFALHTAADCSNAQPLGSRAVLASRTAIFLANGTLQPEWVLLGRHAIRRDAGERER
jgi:hypothetical protein